MTTFMLRDHITKSQSATAASGVLSDDGFLTLAQSLEGGASEVVVLSPEMLRQLVRLFGGRESTSLLAA